MFVLIEWQRVLSVPPGQPYIFQLLDIIHAKWNNQANPVVLRTTNFVVLLVRLGFFWPITVI